MDPQISCYPMLCSCVFPILNNSKDISPSCQMHWVRDSPVITAQRSFLHTPLFVFWYVIIWLLKHSLFRWDCDDIDTLTLIVVNYPFIKLCCSVYGYLLHLSQEQNETASVGNIKCDLESQNPVYVMHIMMICAVLSCFGLFKIDIGQSSSGISL